MSFGTNGRKRSFSGFDEPIDIDQPGPSGIKNYVILLSDSEDDPVIQEPTIPPPNKHQKIQPNENGIIEIPDDEDEPQVRGSTKIKDRVSQIHPHIISDPLPLAQKFASTLMGFSGLRLLGTVREPLPMPEFKRPKILLRDNVKKENLSEEEDESEDESFSCGICMESLSDIKKAGKKVMTTPCGHPFCNGCLEMSAKSSNYDRLPQPQSKVNHCPKCRKLYALKDRIELYL